MKINLVMKRYPIQLVASSGIIVVTIPDDVVQMPRKCFIRGMWGSLKTQVKENLDFPQKKLNG